MTLKAETRARPLLGRMDTEVPHVIAQRYGTAAGAPGTTLAVWSEDVQVTRRTQERRQLHGHGDCGRRAGQDHHGRRAGRWRR